MENHKLVVFTYLLDDIMKGKVHPRMQSFHINNIQCGDLLAMSLELGMMNEHLMGSEYLFSRTIEFIWLEI